MRFDVDVSTIKTRELIEAEKSTEATVELMARFLCDENGERVPLDEAKERLLDLTLDKLAEYSEAFLAAFRRQNRIARR